MCSPCCPDSRARREAKPARAESDGEDEKENEDEDEDDLIRTRSLAMPA